MGTQHIILNSILEEATKNFFASKYPQAICLFEEALSLISADPFFDKYNLTDYDVCVIKYSLCSCYVTQENYFQKANDEFIPLVLSCGNQFPILYYGLAKLCFAQQCFQQTENVIRNGLKALGDVKEKTAFIANWPGTEVQIPESDCDVLINLLKSLEKQCFVIKRMESSEIYQSDEFESDDTIMEFDKEEEEENAYLLNNQTECNLLEGVTNKIQIQPIENTSEQNVTKKLTSILNANVPEFFPKVLKKELSSVNNSPEINVPPSSSASETKISCASEINTIFASKIKDELNDNTAKSSQYHSKGCQTYVPKMIEKPIPTQVTPISVFTQTLNAETEQQICNCKQQIEENEQKVERLKEYYEQNCLKDRQKILVAENLAQIAAIKLEAHKEVSEDKVTILEAKINEQRNKIDHLTKNNQIMQSVITTQSMQYFSLQRGVLISYLNKCRKMVFDLTAVLSYLSVQSIPTITECQRHVKLWQTQLENIEHCSALLKGGLEQVTSDIRLGNFTDVSKFPDLVSELAEYNDILHDSFVPAIRSLLKDNFRNYQENLQFQKKYSQWWNTYLLFNQPKPAIVAAAGPQYYNVPQGSSAVQISDVTASSVTKKSDVMTSPNTYLKSSTKISNASKEDEKSSTGSGISGIKLENVKINETDNSYNSKLEQELIETSTNLLIDSEQERNIKNETKWWRNGILSQTRPVIVAAEQDSSVVQINDVIADNSNTSANAESVTDNLKPCQDSNEEKSSTSNFNSLTDNFEPLKHYKKTVAFVDNKECEMEDSAISLNSNASKKDEKSFICDGICDTELKNIKINEAANSDNSKLELIETSTDLTADSKEQNKTKLSIKPFTIRSKERLLQPSIIDETKQEAALNDALRNSKPTQSSKGNFSNSVPLLNWKQTEDFNNASNLASIHKHDYDLPAVQVTKIDDSQQEDCNISDVFYFQATCKNGSKPKSEQNTFLYSVTENYKPLALSSSHKLNDNCTAASVTHLTQVPSTTPKEVPKSVDYSQLPEAIRKAGRSFCDLYLYVKERVPEKTDMETFSALKRVRRKNTKLSGMAKDSIVAAVKIELKIDGCMETSASALAVTNSEDKELNEIHTQTMCIVCIEPFGNGPLAKLPCQHTFHRKCITQWFIYKNDCPVCRVFVA